MTLLTALTLKKRRAGDDGFATDEEEFDASRPLNNINTEFITEKAPEAKKKRHRVQKFTIQDLSPYLKGRCVDLFDAYVVDFFYAQHIRTAGETDTAIVSLWKKKFPEEAEKAGSRQRIQQVKAVCSSSLKGLLTS